MFHEGKDLAKLFGDLGAPQGFPESFIGFAGGGRSLEGKGVGPQRALPGRAKPLAKIVPDLSRAREDVGFAGAFPGDPGGD